MPIQLSVSSRGKIKGANFPLEINLPDGATLGMLRNGIHHLVPHLNLDRQRVTDVQKKPLFGDEKRLVELGVRSGDSLQVKDLGMQISWRTVFLVEYRELETLFVHRFSNATMPIFNIFKNSAHYWLLSGVLLALGVYSPYHGEKAVRRTYGNSPMFIGCMVAIWALAELGNLHSHLILRSLRPAGSRVRKIPYGGLFSLVSCPNYFFEVLAWAAVTVLTSSFAALLFTIVSAAQMTIWAVKKHKAYRREFSGQYPKDRKIMYPFIF
ncbi:very-long-chain enoyl-CoA reductase [Malassezia psittaci]|uniref:Very-long-chain enoyl-CoA reductase n=1 Tax=Malassezia psittaci TaxID=1821823 RepID=A0AAF0F6Q1_9BASI|nr:very-long-chain enoyl-CoA reductase [Malassezia psittaci]